MSYIQCAKKCHKWCSWSEAPLAPHPTPHISGHQRKLLLKTESCGGGATVIIWRGLSVPTSQDVPVLKTEKPFSAKYLEALNNWIICFCSFWYIYHNNSCKKNKDTFLRKNTDILVRGPKLGDGSGVGCQPLKLQWQTFFDIIHIQGPKQRDVGCPVWNELKKICPKHGFSSNIKQNLQECFCEWMYIKTLTLI